MHALLRTPNLAIQIQQHVILIAQQIDAITLHQVRYGIATP